MNNRIGVASESSPEDVLEYCAAGMEGYTVDRTTAREDMVARMFGSS